uniref:Uncharacterized protein n=1 Tax=Anguilla anguilla TaxID=7936 RepID=A0A0E9XBF6_ANGAN
MEVDLIQGSVHVHPRAPLSYVFRCMIVIPAGI